MPVDALTWLLAALAALAGAATDLGAAQRQRRTRLAEGLIAVSAGAALAGLGWRAWQTGTWPGAAAAEGLALLAAAAEIMALWPRRGGAGSFPARAFAGAGAGLLLAGAAILGWRSPAPAASASASAWLFGVRSALVGIGGGGLLLAAAGSVWGRMRRPVVAPATVAWGDAGRAAALAGYPWLTAAGLASILWNLATQAAIVRAAPGDLWLWAAWLLGGVYLHATSGWRPLRLPGRWAPLIAAAAALAGLLAAWHISSVTG